MLLRHIVVHAIVEKSGQLLLIKRAEGFPEGGKWALPGGFLDRDENLSQGVLREMLEETGWRGKIVSLFRINSNPYRPKEDRQNVALEYIIKPIKQISKPDQESAKVEWIPLEKLFDKEKFAFDMDETIELYKQYRQQPFPLPLVA